MSKWSPFRKIRFWVIYDPAKRVIVRSAKFKRLLPKPSRRSRRVIIECTGFYPAGEGESNAK